MKQLSVNMRKNEILLGLIYIVFHVFFLPLIIVTLNVLLPLSFTEAELNFIAFAINFICVTVIFHQYLLNSLKIFIHNVKGTFTAVFKGFGAYWIGSILVNILVISLDPEFSNVNDNAIATLTNQNYILMGIGTVILVPIVEETLYRGVIFGTLFKKNSFAAYVISIVAFSALHIVGYIGHYSPIRLSLCFLQYIPAALFLAWSYVKADTIIAPILIHMIVNLIGMLAMLQGVHYA